MGEAGGLDLGRAVGDVDVVIEACHQSGWHVKQNRRNRFTSERGHCCGDVMSVESKSENGNDHEVIEVAVDSGVADMGGPREAANAYETHANEASKSCRY